MRGANGMLEGVSCGTLASQRRAADAVPAVTGPARAGAVNQRGSRTCAAAAAARGADRVSAARPRNVVRALSPSAR